MWAQQTDSFFQIMCKCLLTEIFIRKQYNSDKCHSFLILYQNCFKLMPYAKNTISEFLIFLFLLIVACENDLACSCHCADCDTRLRDSEKDIDIKLYLDGRIVPRGTDLIKKEIFLAVCVSRPVKHQQTPNL